MYSHLREDFPHLAWRKLSVLLGQRLCDFEARQCHRFDY